MTETDELRSVKNVVKPGDMIIVPAGVVHGWLDIADHVEYLSFRPSPGILTTGWAHPVLKKQPACDVGCPGDAGVASPPNTIASRFTFCHLS